MEWFDYFGGPVRSPLLKINDNDKKLLAQGFYKNGFLSEEQYKKIVN